MVSCEGNFLLKARVEEELFVYEAFPFHQAKSDLSHLKIRFKKLQHNLLLRERKQQRYKKRDALDPDEGATKEGCVALLRYFNDVSGYSGVSFKQTIQ